MMFCASSRPAAVDMENVEADRARSFEPQPITPWAPQPVRRIAMPQIWRRLTFLHWPYPPDRIRPLIPAGLELDTFDNAAWVGLVPFEIYGIPAVPHFPETNLRTYVIGPDGSRAVWFFCLEAARLAAVVGARIGYHLPYFWSAMSVRSRNGEVLYRSRRRWPHDARVAAKITIQPGELYQPGELGQLDHFLTARFRLYSMARRGLQYAQIEHPPWPLARANLIDLEQTLFEPMGLPPPAGPPLVHYSGELAVKIGRLDLH